MVTRRTYTNPVWANDKVLQAIKVKRKTWARYRSGDCEYDEYKAEEKATKKKV